MCRLFGFHSIAKTNKNHVHQSLVTAENALIVQSKYHPDGWGIAYYLHGVPHVIKSLHSANTDEAFRKLGQTINSNTVIAHVRSATQGEVSLINCHPFQYGQWVMAHNGNLPFFRDVKEELIRDINQELLSHVFGTTDSEIYFILLIHELEKFDILKQKNPSLHTCAQAFRSCVSKIEKIYERANLTGDLSLNIILTNGNLMLGYRFGRDLYFSNQSDYLLISSEPLLGEESSQSFVPRQIIGCDHELKIFRDL